MRELLTGIPLALVSDAGLPAVSDPGGRLIAAAVEAGIPIIPVPGGWNGTLCVASVLFSTRSTDQALGSGKMAELRSGGGSAGYPVMVVYSN